MRPANGAKRNWRSAEDPCCSCICLQLAKPFCVPYHLRRVSKAAMHTSADADLRSRAPRWCLLCSGTFHCATPWLLPQGAHTVRSGEGVQARVPLRRSCGCTITMLPLQLRHRAQGPPGAQVLPTTPHPTRAGHDAEPASVRAVAIAYRFQRSPRFAAEWIDPGDPVSSVVQSFREELLGHTEDEVLLPILPQPLNKLVTFLIFPSWAVEMFLTPVLISVTHPEGSIRFVEMLPGRVTTVDIRDSVGESWPPEARVYIEDALRPLEEEEIAHLRPGSLISVVQGRGRPPLTHPLSYKIQEPSFWFRNADEEGFPPDTAGPTRIGILGGCNGTATVPIQRAQSPQQLRASIAHKIGLNATAFRTAAPEHPVRDLLFRGVPVIDVVGIVPEALHACVAVFVDARDLACPVQLLLLPPFRTTLQRIMHLIGAFKPLHRRLQVRGSSSFCGYTESLLPEPNSVLCISLAPAWCDDERTRNAPSNSTPSGSEVHQPPAEGRASGPSTTEAAPPGISAVPGIATAIARLSTLSFGCNRC